MSSQHINKEATQTIHLDKKDRNLLSEFIVNSLKVIGGDYKSEQVERIVEVFYATQQQGLTVTIIND